MILAIDIGGTNLRAALVDAEGNVSERESVRTPKDPDPDVLLDLARSVLGRGDVEGAVVGVPGRVDYSIGALEYAPNLPSGWRDELSEPYLRGALGIEVAVANDADLAAVGEAWFGAGRDFSSVAYLTISTGIGAGVVMGGLLVHGRRSVAEVGHTIVDGRALLEKKKATIEQLGSGTALTALAKEAGIAEDGEGLVELVRDGNPTAERIFERVVYAAAVGAVNLAHLFTPDVIVVGGGLGLVGELVLEPIRALVRAQGPHALPEPICVKNAELGDDAGLAGAGAWSRAFSAQAAARVNRVR